MYHAHKCKNAKLVFICIINSPESLRVIRSFVEKVGYMYIVIMSARLFARLEVGCAFKQSNSSHGRIHDFWKGDST